MLNSYLYSYLVLQIEYSYLVLQIELCSYASIAIKPVDMLQLREWSVGAQRNR